MQIVFLDAGTMGDTSLAEIAALGTLTVYNDTAREDSLLRAADADVAIVNKVIVDDTFLDHAPKLRLVCEAGTGINNIDTQACERRGVVVRNVAGYSTDSVAQNAVMHLLNLLGNAFYYDDYVKSGTYSQGKLHTDPSHPFTEAAGKTLGIVGMGAIGQKVARIATALGMRVIYYSTSGTGHCQDYPCVSLDELLEGSDAISIHAPLNARTKGLIGQAQLRKMKPTAVLVNNGRGGIAIEADLAKAINEGWIAGVGLDVFETEPLPSDSPLLHTRHPERIHFTPHVAWASREARARLAHEMAENIKKGW